MARHLKTLVVKFNAGIRVLLCLALVAWSVAQMMGHSPQAPEVVSHHAEMVVEHGHSHDHAEDLWWALHGHHHDLVDHDHRPGILSRLTEGRYLPVKRVRWRSLMTSAVSIAVEPLERPPRA